MSKTTIELSEGTKQKLRKERQPHETNYNETIERLLGEDQSPYVMESEVKSIISDMVVREALQ